MNIWTKLGRLGVGGQAAIVVLGTVALWLALCPLASSISGTDGVLAAAAAGAVCLLGGIAALAVGPLFHGSLAPLYRMLTGMIARTFISLSFGLALHFQVPRLTRGGLVFYLLVFYFATLAIDTLITLAQVSNHRAV